MTNWYPIHFKPVYQSYLWGGRNLAAMYSRQDVPEAGPVAESWEVSDRHDGMSLVANGARAGQTLSELMARDRKGILGTSRAGAAFPLLIKILDARETLSIQVHPDDAAASRGIGEAKSEAWYALAASPDACVYRGFRPGLSEQEARASLTNGRMVESLVRTPVQRGDFIYVPGGTVHAIGAGCLFLEVQQNSNTTYRLFDWNRTGPDGKARALHLEEGSRVIHWQPAPAVDTKAREGAFVTPYFSVAPVRLDDQPRALTDPAGGFTVVFVESGAAVVDFPGGRYEATAGTSWLLPAALSSCTATAQGPDAGLILIRGVRAG